MIYRLFGRTGLEISVLSAGFMRAMQSWQCIPDDEIKSSSQRNFEDIVRAALAHGINHFETAHAYGTSEKQLGIAVRDVPRDSFILQTKVLPTSNPQRFIEKVNISLDRLNVERVDLLAIHGINDYRSLWHVCRPNGCLAAARSLQKQGKVGAIGFSGHGPADVIVEAIHHEDNGGFDYVNLHWYYIYQVNSTALEEASRRGLGVFIISPNDKGGMLQEPPDKFSQLCTPMEPMVFNDVYCLAQSEVSTISIGASKPSDFDLHVGALEYLDSSSLVAEIDERCGREMLRATGFSRPEALWTKLPTWENTPGLINIPFILWLYNLARGWGMVDYSRRRYKKIGREMQWVPGNNGAGAANHNLESIAEKAGLENDTLVNLLQDAHNMLYHDAEK